MSSPWRIPGIDARLRELHPDRTVSFRDIAIKLNEEFGTHLTRHSCIGRADRLGLEKRPSPILPNKQTVPVEPKPKPKPKPKPTLVAPAIPGPITLLELRDCHCHYPLGEIESRPPFLYCGKPAHAGSSWCEAHYRAIYVPTRVRWA